MFRAPPDWWDPHSCQPYKLDVDRKPRFGLTNLVEYARTAGSALLSLPFIAGQYLALKPSPSGLSAAEFAGLAVSPLAGHDDEVVDMVDELGVRELMLRMPAWESDDADLYARYIERFPGRNFCINVLQSREDVLDLELWRTRLRRIASVLGRKAQSIWIGNAINRTKWGCAHSGEYLKLQEVAEELRAEYPELTIAGSSVIDFEPLVSWRTVWNFNRYDLDVVASLMYVNRRHSPFNTQYGIFDLHNKLRLIKAMSMLGNRCSDRVWVTETNWPLLDTKPYTPNSGHPSRTVDEETQAKYLKQYFQIAWQCGWAERVYWWQLVNPGYGLVDSRDGALRRMPSYTAFKEIMDGGLTEPPV